MASTQAHAPWRAASNLSELSYQLLFGLTVAFLPHFFGFCGDPASSSEALLLLRRHQSRLEDDCGGQRRQEREGHQLAHARRTRVMRETQASESNSRCAGAEEDGAR